MAADIFRAQAGATVTTPANLISSPFVASRARFLNVAATDLHKYHFDPAPWMHPFDAACYLEPRILEYDAGECPLPVSKFGASRDEAITYVQTLDKANRLFLADCSECPPKDRMNLLAVYKSESVDRTVWDRRRRNWRERHVAGAASDLPTGYDLVDCFVGPQQRAYLFADDISDMYPCFVAPPTRALTNGIAIELTPEECHGMKALRRFANKDIPRRLVPCCSGLVMGDVNAVDFATGAHLSVLQHAQAIPEQERVLHGVVPPRGASQHALVIDDHIGLAVGERATSASVIAMGEAFDRGTAACNEAGLPHHPGKRVRAATDGVALGAELVDGRFLGTERARRMLLSVFFAGHRSGRYGYGSAHAQGLGQLDIFHVVPEAHHVHSRFVLQGAAFR